MSDIRIANRYAKSILELAQEQNALDAVAQDVTYLSKAFDNRDLINLIKSPIIHKDKKRSIFSKLFGDKLSKLTNAFLSKVITKGREDVIPEMMEAFTQQYNDKMGIVSVILTTTSSIGDDLLALIKSKINEITGPGKQVSIETKINDDLIGGFIVEFEDKRYDASILHQLENLKKTYSS